jgi:opacity protein-like surface antigen
MPEVEVPHSAENKEEKQVGIIIAIMAVVLAIISAAGKDAVNNLIVSEVEASNGYAWYQAKRQRSYLNELEIQRIQIELLGTPTDAQRSAMETRMAKLEAKNAEYEEENKKILVESDRHKADSLVASAKNEGFDRSEILLQVAVVLCSLTLLTGMRAFLKVGVVVALVGIGFGVAASRIKAEPTPAPAAPAPAPVKAPALGTASSP